MSVGGHLGFCHFRGQQLKKQPCKPHGSKLYIGTEVCQQYTCNDSTINFFKNLMDLVYLNLCSYLAVRRLLYQSILCSHIETFLRLCAKGGVFMTLCFRPKYSEASFGRVGDSQATIGNYELVLMNKTQVSMIIISEIFDFGLL